jgi:hypothetical protein
VTIRQGVVTDSEVAACVGLQAVDFEEGLACRGCDRPDDIGTAISSEYHPNTNDRTPKQNIRHSPASFDALIVLWQRRESKRESKAAADNENYVNTPERKRS